MEDATAVFSREQRSQRNYDTDILALYLKQISVYPLLDAEEELFLARLIAKQRDRFQWLSRSFELGDKRVTTYMLAAAKEELLSSKNKMINANLRLVVSIAKDIRDTALSFLDIINEGNIGLIEAVERYDHKKGCRFSTYGSWWIRQTIQKGIADKSRTIRIPAHMLIAMKRYSMVTTYLTEELGRAPNIDELAQYLGCEPSKIQDILPFNQEIASLDMDVDDEGMATLVDLVIDRKREQPFDEFLHVSLKNRLNEILHELPMRERRIIQLRFGIGNEGPFTLEKTGEHVGITRERVRQVQEQAMKRLRSIIQGYQDIYI